MNLASSGLVLVLARLVEVCVGVTRQVVVGGGGAPVQLCCNGPIAALYCWHHRLHVHSVDCAVITVGKHACDMNL